jgi:uncharacterized protein YqgC (DUF456 family)
VVFGQSFLGVTYRPSIVAALSTAIVSYVLTLIGVYVVALVIDGLAPSFGAVKDRTQAFKVAAFGATAGWVIGIVGLIPALGVLGLLGLYSLYLIYLGLPVLMKAPADKAMGYTAVIVGVTVVAALILGALTAPLVGLMTPSAALDRGEVTGSLSVPGVGAVDLGKLDAASKQLTAAAEGVASGEGTKAIAPDILQGLLPAALPGGLARTSVENSSAGAGGLGGSHAEASYGAGDDVVKLSMTDLGAVGGLAALGGALDVQSSRQTGTSYEKTGKVDGRITSEKYDSGSRSGSYSQIVGDRVMIEAEGNAGSIDVFKAAVGSIDAATVEGLVRR